MEQEKISIELKREFDVFFFIMCFIVVVVILLALFKIPMLCIDEAEIRTYTENGMLKQEIITLNITSCYPVIKYFNELKEIKKLQEKDLKELYAEQRYGFSQPIYNESLLSNSSS